MRNLYMYYKRLKQSIARLGSRDGQRGNSVGSGKSGASTNLSNDSGVKNSNPEDKTAAGTVGSGLWGMKDLTPVE